MSLNRPPVTKVWAILILAVSLSAFSQPASTPLVTLSIVGTNDLHGGIVAKDGNGGLALFGGYVKNLRAVRARDGGAVVLVDGGDMFQGTLESSVSEGAPVVAAYNALGYAAAAVGNHEFDFGPVGPAATPRVPADDPRGALKARAAEAHFPFLAANLIETSTGHPVTWPNVKPSVLVEVAGIRTGIIGVMTQEALRSTLSGNTHGLMVAPLGATIADQAAQLRSQGAVVVVVAAHAGGRCTTFDQPRDLSSCDQRAEIITVARNLPRGLVDIIVAGHTHAGMSHEVEGIAITAAYAGGVAFGRVDLVVDRAEGKVTSRRIFPPRILCLREDPLTHDCDATAASGTRVPSQYEGAPVVPDARIAAVLAPALKQARPIKVRPVGVILETPIRRQGTVESPLGNLFTDALRDSVPGADVALNNTDGGLRADLPRGPLTYGSVFELMPFDNQVVPLHLTGAGLKRVFASQLQRTSRLLGISGIRVRAQCESESLKIALTRSSSGLAIDDEERLVVVTTDFLATGGSGLLTPVIPPEGFAIPDDAPLARDVFAAQLTRRGGRLREADLIDLRNPRWNVLGTLPISCR
jgi:2',3'-cyclic-nucleotide 2'-phosphodiesterase (5'-nucleotidase family)